MSRPMDVFPQMVIKGLEGGDGAMSRCHGKCGQGRLLEAGLTQREEGEKRLCIWGGYSDQRARAGLQWGRGEGGVNSEQCWGPTTLD